jgi:outer membrane biosynthesis protein TonB
MRPMLLALVATVVLHAVLGVWLSEPHRFALRLPVVAPRVSVTALPVDPAKLPASMRVAETTSQGNREVPADTSLVAARNQSAAQPVPEKVPTRSALPRSQGESADSLRLAQAVPRKVEEVMDAPAKAEAGTPRVAVDPTPAAPSPQPRPPAAQPATPRVSLPSGTSGLLLRNPVGVNRAGAVSLDARFSSYGDYSQRMLEAIQGSWWGLIDRTHLDEFSSGYVVVRFRIHRDGTITDAEVVASTVPSLASLICKDAILLPAPYDTWRADMVAMLGEDETVTITFHYR